LNQKNTVKSINRTLSCAPMLDWTDRYFRYFARLITRHTLLYTEMVTTGALIHGDKNRFLDFHACEHPIALQLGGSDPKALAECCRIADEWGYDEINLNVGCPSDKVQSGRFGACLMAQPKLVAECVQAMKTATDRPVTVKHRIGIDDHDSYEALCDFVGTVADSGCETFIIHARKAWLEGLSPRENREIPPLQYDTVHKIKTDFPDLEIIINGGIVDLDQANEQLESVDGVMIGRAAYHNTWVLADADRRFFGDDRTIPNAHEVIEQLLPFVDQMLLNGHPLNRMTRHILGLFQGRPGAKAWRRHISENTHKKGATSDVIRQAADLVPLL